MTFHLAPLTDVDQETLYRMLWLRVRVFIVEQAAAYEELDGRDLESGTRLMWAESDGDVLGTLRVLTDPDAMRIGRVATAPSARGRGVGADLMARAVEYCTSIAPTLPIVLDAQLHLAHWYGRFGFVVSGEPFIEDEIPHTPMRRDPR